MPVGKASRTAKTVTESEPSADETPVVENPEAASTETESAETGDAPAEEAPQEEPILVPHRPAGKRLTIAAAAAGVLFVGAAAFAGATLQPFLADRALVDTKLDVARTAANAITTLWTYTPDNMDKLPDRSAGYLGGDFANEYRKYIDAIVATNKQAQVTNTTAGDGRGGGIGDADRGHRDRVHQFGGHQPGVEEHPVAAVPVLPVDDAAPRRELADHPHVDGDVA